MIRFFKLDVKETRFQEFGEAERILRFIKSKMKRKNGADIANSVHFSILKRGAG